MIHNEFIQGSDEWRAYKAGRISGSSLYKIMPTKTGRYSTIRAHYLDALANESFTGELTETFETEAMARGKELEAEARTTYELETGNIVKECGFIDHPTIQGVGISPDGISDLKNPKKGLEIKCRLGANHTGEIIAITKKGADGMDKAALYQCHLGMMCADCSEWDYVLYNPDAKIEWLRFFCFTVKRDPKIEAEITAELLRFQAELKQYILDLKGLKEILTKGTK